jgi:hypothetical protein
VDTDAQQHPLQHGQIAIARASSAAGPRRRAYCLHGRSHLHQRPVASALHDPPPRAGHTGSTAARWSCQAASVPSSSSDIIAEYPTTSTTATAASRLVPMSSPPVTADPVMDRPHQGDSRANDQQPPFPQPPAPRSRTRQDLIDLCPLMWDLVLRGKE